MYSYKHIYPEPAVSCLGREGPSDKIGFSQQTSHTISRPTLVEHLILSQETA